MKLPIDQIVIGPRQRIDLGSLDELAASLRDNGQIQPIVVDDANNLIAGRRRLAAALSLGWTEIDVVQRDNLTATQKQILEYEEDVRRLDRSWQEKCLAVRAIHQLKTAEANAAGNYGRDAWTRDQTAVVVGFSGGHVRNMLVVADALANAKREEPLWACKGFLEAYKLLVEVEAERAKDEMERRRSRGSSAPTAADVATPTVATPASVVEKPTVPTTKLRLYGYQQNFMDREELVLASTAIVFDPSSHIIQNLFDLMPEHARVFLWFKEPVVSSLVEDAINDSEWQRMPWLVIWNKVTLGAPTVFPFVPNYSVGILLSKWKQVAVPNPQSSIITALVQQENELPLQIVTASLKALGVQQGDHVLLPKNAPAVAVATAGCVPLWYERDPIAFDKKLAELRAYYTATVPNVEFV